MIFLDDAGIQYFGFRSGNAFFQVQGGVFHLVMCSAYVLAATNLPKSRLIILFIILAKAIAFIYLLIYYFCIDSILVVLLSGILDGIMAVLAYSLYRAMPAHYFRGGGS